MILLGFSAAFNEFSFNLALSHKGTNPGGLVSFMTKSTYWDQYLQWLNISSIQERKGIWGMCV